MSRLVALQPLEPGKPVDVVERDESGALVGAWHGYWSFKRGTVALYPNPKNRYVTWPNGELPKKRIVSDREIKANNAGGGGHGELTPSTASGRPPSRGRLNTEGEALGGVQQQMKFY